MVERGWRTQEHPSLFFGRGDVEGLRQKRRVTGVAAAAWGRLEDHIRAGLALEPPRPSPRWEWDTGSDGQKNLGSVAGDLNRAVLSLGLSWILDGERAHARRATDLLMAACDLDFWTSPRFFGTDYRLPWRGTLETAMLCHGVACGYDWLCDFMSQAERQRLRTCLLYKGIQPLVQDWADPLTRLPLSTHILPWGNWWQNCIAPAGEAAMALWGEHPLAERCARLCREGSDAFFAFGGAAVPQMPPELLLDEPGTYYPANFDEEGGYWEGLNYMDGVLINSFLFDQAYQRQTGEGILPVGLMEKVAGFILDGSFRAGDRMRAANFGDCRAGFATSPLVTAYLAARLRHGGLQWFLHGCAGNFDDASLFRYYESPAFTFLWYDPGVVPQEPQGPPPVKTYPGASWSVLRSGWGTGDSMLVLKCGATAGHAHADAGSFVLYTRDELVLVDSGVCGYEMPEYQDYYHTTRAHSTVLVGDRGQRKRLPGRLVTQAAVPGLGFVLGDASAPYEGRLGQFLRGVLFVGSAYYVVVDWLRKDGDDPFRWLLHYDGQMREESGAYAIRKGRAGVRLDIAEPHDHVLALQQGLRSYHEDLSTVKGTVEKQGELEPGPCLQVSPSRNRRRQCFLAVLYPFDSQAPAPPVQRVEAPGWVGVRVERGAEVDLVGLRRPGSRTRADLCGVETDARLFCLSRLRDGRGARVLLHEGTYLRSGGRTLVCAEKRVTTAVEVDGLVAADLAPPAAPGRRQRRTPR